MRWLLRLLGMRPRKETTAEALARPDAWARFMVEMRSDMLSDEVYMEIYKGDLEAIAEAKASWARAGEQVIEFCSVTVARSKLRTLRLGERHGGH